MFYRNINWKIVLQRGPCSTALATPRITGLRSPSRQVRPPGISSLTGPPLDPLWTPSWNLAPNLKGKDGPF
eukprot:1179419-Prorocentrum_minimum.AAC.2